MKNVFVILFTIFSLSAFSQNITQLSLTASGLTCSMCSKAIYKSLVKLPSVEKVDADIQTSSYTIFLKPGSKVVLADFKKAVQDAGFSVAGLRIKANFAQAAISPGGELAIEGNRIVLPGVEKQVLEGSKTLLLIDKGYLSEKDRRKYDRQGQGGATLSGATDASTPGIAAPIPGSGEVYHAVILQS